MKYKLVKLDWQDASTHDSWQTLEEAAEDRDGHFIVHTIGWLIGETNGCYILGTSLSANGLSAATWRIPKGMVVKRTNIKGFDLEYE